MTMFSYSAFNSIGTMQEGKIEAPSKDEALDLLSLKQLTPLNIREGKLDPVIRRKDRVKIKRYDVLNFTQQLLSLVQAGIPLAQALSLMIEQSSDANIRLVISRLHDQVREGKSFSNALKQFPQIFSELYTNSIAIAENGGNLDNILRDLAEKLESDNKIFKNIKKTLSYPAFLLTTVFAAFIVFSVYIVPKFIPVFQNSNAELPLPTKIIIQMNNFFIEDGLFALLGLITAGLFFYKYIKSNKGRAKLHANIYRVPFLGSIFNKISSQRFSKTTAILIGQGLPLVQAMHIASRTEPNLFFKEKIEKMGQLLISGQSISAALKAAGVFPHVMIHMITVGEISGSLEQMLNKAAELFHTEISNTIDNFTSFIEPVITIILAFMVLFLALAIFLPMWNMIGI